MAGRPFSKWPRRQAFRSRLSRTSSQGSDASTSERASGAHRRDATLVHAEPSRESARDRLHRCARVAGLFDGGGAPAEHVPERAAARRRPELHRAAAHRAPGRRGDPRRPTARRSFRGRAQEGRHAVRDNQSPARRVEPVLGRQRPCRDLPSRGRSSSRGRVPPNGAADDRGGHDVRRRLPRRPSARRSATAAPSSSPTISRAARRPRLQSKPSQQPIRPMPSSASTTSSRSRQ